MDTSPTIHKLHGRIFTPTTSNPAAGAEVLVTVPDRRRWLIHSIQLDLTTDVNVADRLVTLIIDDGSDSLFILPATTVQAASLNHRYFYAGCGHPEIIAGTYRRYGLPPIPLAAGSRIQTSTSLIQVGDDYAAPVFLVEEWIDP